MTNRSHLLISTISVSSVRLFGQAMVLISSLLIANFFGATKSTDDYYTALILPGALGNLVINALTNLFPPIYLQHIHDDPEQGQSILSSMMFVVSAALLAATVISLVAVPLVTATRSIGEGDALARALLVGFLLVVNCPLVGYTRLLSVYSETHQHYSVPAVMDVLGAILFVAVLVLTLPLGIYSLVIANLVSNISETLLLAIYTNRALGLQLRPSFRIHPAVKEMLRLSLEPALAFLAMFLVPTVDRVMATRLGAGSLTTFSYGDRIVTAFDNLMLSGPLLIIYYHWAKINAAHGIQAVARSVPEMISLLNFVFVPICVGGALLSYPIMSILFGRGAFTAVAVSAHVFAILCLSEIFSFLIVLLVRLMLLIKLTRAQVILSIGVSMLNAVLNIALIGPFGLQGIVFSTLLTRIIVTIAAFGYVRRYFPEISFRPVLTRFAQTLFSLAIMVAVVYGLQQVFGQALMRAYGLLLQVGATASMIAVGAAAYGLTAWFVRHADLVMLVQAVSQTRYGFLLRRAGITAE